MSVLYFLNQREFSVSSVKLLLNFYSLVLCKKVNLFYLSSKNIPTYVSNLKNAHKNKQQGGAQKTKCMSLSFMFHFTSVLHM